MHIYRENYMKIQCQVCKYGGRPRKLTTTVVAHYSWKNFVIFNMQKNNHLTLKSAFQPFSLEELYFYFIYKKVIK